MKANRLTLLVSILAIILSVIAISTSLPRTEMSFDYLGFITGSLGFLVTVLLGWNIYTIFDFRQERQNLKTYFDEQKQSVKAVGSDLRMTFKNQIANVSLLEKHIPVTKRIRRSKPRPKPACGHEPYLRVSRYQLISFIGMLRASISPINLS